MRELMELRPGLVVDYELDLLDRDRFGRVLGHVAQIGRGRDTEPMVDAALAATDHRDVLEGQSRPFIDPETSNRTVDFSGPNGAWLGERSWIEAAIEDYQALIRGGSQ